MLDGAIILNENILLDIFGDDGTTDLIAVKVRNEKEMAKTKENLEKLPKIVVMDSGLNEIEPLKNLIEIYFVLENLMYLMNYIILLFLFQYRLICFQAMAMIYLIL